MPLNPLTQKEEEIATIVADIVSAMSLNAVQNLNEPQLTISPRPQIQQQGNPNDKGEDQRNKPAFQHQPSFFDDPPAKKATPAKVTEPTTQAKDTKVESGPSLSSEPMSHESSKTWSQFEMEELEKWKIMEPLINRMFPPDRLFGKSSPFVPRTAKEWIEHRKAMEAAEAEKQRRKLAYEATQKAMGNPERFQAKPFYGKQFGSFAQGKDGDGLDASPNPPTRGAVLGQHTIWVGLNSPVAPPWRVPAPWPCKQEMEWEGDQRVATESGVWHQKPRVKPYPFDEVWKVPTEEDILAPVDEIEDPEIIAQLLNKDILDAIDNEP